MPLPASVFDVLVPAASVGGLNALSGIPAELPAGFPAPVVVLQRFCPGQPSLLADILSRRTPLRVRQAQEGDVPRPAAVFTPVPGRRLPVRPGGALSLSQAPRALFVRPSADPLSESAASAFGGRAVAIVLTGTGQDGARGVRWIHKGGGFVIAPDEATSECFAMPAAAIKTGMVDRVLPIHDIASAVPERAGSLGG